MEHSATCFRWRRQAVLLAVIGLLLASAGTALATPRAKPVKQVTMTISGQYGLATTCPASGPIAMSGSGVLRGRGQNLEANIDVGWDRVYDSVYVVPLPGYEPITDTYDALTGCHGNLGLNVHTWDRPDPNNPGVLEITPRGDTVEILWRFDYYVDPDGRVMPNGKKTLLLEFLEIASDGPVSWDSGIVSGSFTFRRYTSGEWVEFGVVELTFTMTIT